MSPAQCIPEEFSLYFLSDVLHILIVMNQNGSAYNGKI